MDSKESFRAELYKMLRGCCTVILQLPVREIYGIHAEFLQILSDFVWFLVSCTIIQNHKDGPESSMTKVRYHDQLQQAALLKDF